MAAGTYDRAKVTELKEVVTGRAPGRSGPDEITLFKSVGTAIQDVAAGFAVYKEAVAIQRSRRSGGEFLEGQVAILRSSPTDSWRVLAEPLELKRGQHSPF